MDNVGMKISVSTRGFTDILDITPQVRLACAGIKTRDGVCRRRFAAKDGQQCRSSTGQAACLPHGPWPCATPALVR
jgi:hypothetical protein